MYLSSNLSPLLALSFLFLFVPAYLVSAQHNAFRSGHLSFSGKINLDQPSAIRSLNAVGHQSTNNNDGSRDCSITFKGRQRQFVGCDTLSSGQLEVFWTINDTAIETAFRISREDGSGYVGFGYGYNLMLGTTGRSNAIIAYITSSGDAEAQEYEMTEKRMDGVQPRSGSGSSYATIDADSDASTLTGYFVRPLQASGLPTIARGRTQFIWAKGGTPTAPNALPQHASGTSNRAPGIIGLSAASGGGVTETGSAGFGAFYIVHGVLMSVAWALIAPLAILSARFLRSRDPLWFYIHRTLMALVIAVVLAAYIMGVVRGNHTEVLHLVFGTVVTAGALLQGVGGLLRPDKEASFRPKWRFLHSWFGRIVVGIAFANIIIGLDIFGVSAGSYIAVSVVFGLLVLGGIVCGISKRSMKKSVPAAEKVKDTSDVA